jgi:hypothetical protein
MAADHTDPVLAKTMAETQQKMARVIAQAMADQVLRKRLTADPTAVFAEHGVKFEGWRFQVVPNEQAASADVNKKIISFALPSSPSGELSDAQLAGVAGGSSCTGSASTASSASTMPSCAASVSTSGTASTQC